MTFSIILSDEPVVLFGAGEVSDADIEVVRGLSGPRVAADGGAPIVVSKPDSPQAEAFRKIARDLIAAGKA